MENAGQGLLSTPVRSLGPPVRIITPQAAALIQRPLFDTGVIIPEGRDEGDAATPAKPSHLSRIPRSPFRDPVASRVPVPGSTPRRRRPEGELSDWQWPLLDRFCGRNTVAPAAFGSTTVLTPISASKKTQELLNTKVCWLWTVIE